MSKIEHQSSIIDQYASDNGIAFYRQVMGDGQGTIHYGIYQNDDESMIDATNAATRSLFKYAQASLGKRPQSILELGSGLGGSAHLLAQECNAKISCVDLSSRFNQNNIETAKRLGIVDRISTWTGSFEQLPMDWSHQFELVWSQEAFCHAYKRKQVFEEAYRCLKPNGVLAFTDVMLSNQLSEKQAKTYSSVNAISTWSNLQQTLDNLSQCGFTQIQHYDWSKHLEQNFQKMLEQIRSHKQDLIALGVEESFIESFEASLKQRLQWAPGEVLCWHAIVATKNDQ